MNVRRQLAALTVAAVCTVAPALAQQGGGQGGMEQGGMGGMQKTQDRDDTRMMGSGPEQVAMWFHDANVLEIQVARLAERNASSKEVRQLASRISRDHARADKKLDSVLRKEKMQVPTGMTVQSAEGMDQMNRLQGLTGPDFDQAYVQAMIDGHQKDIQKFTAAERDLPNGALRNFISKEIPTLRKHLQMAQKVQEDLMSGKGVKGETGRESRGSGMGR